MIANTLKNFAGLLTGMGAAVGASLSGIHFCHEELFAIMAGIPVVQHTVPWLRARFHRKETCAHEHID